MAFIKYANIPVAHIASAVWDDAGIKFVKSASSISFYNSGGSRIDVKAALAMVAEDYNISDNPKDYIFEAVRAVTADVPNQNGDAFPKSELMRFDHRLGKHVYQTFILKPHHINHRADNPKTARGVVLDAFYNDSNPALDTCPACNNRTASAEGRDETGICCKKCGEVVKDEFVELLIAIDTKKDPTFADGVRTGALDSLSMGCEAGYTDCSVCENRARTVAQFCAHIKSGNKKKMFKAASGKDTMSFEKCGEVVFTEISRVDQPADPTALQREVFSVEAASMQTESEMLVLSARLAKIEGAMAKQAQTEPEFSPQMPFKTVAESIRWASNSISKLKGDIAKLTAERDQKHKSASDEGRPLYAWESAAYDTQIKANKQFISRLEGYVLKARELEASGKPFGKDLTRSMSRFFASKEAQTDMTEIQDTLDELGQIHPEMAQELQKGIQDQGQPGVGVQPVGSPQTIGDYAEQQAEELNQPVTSDELGMQVDQNTPPAPPGVKASRSAMELASDLDLVFDTLTESERMSTMNFAASYKNLQADVTSAGNVRIVTSHGPLFVVRGSKNAKGSDLAKQVMLHIAEHGIVDTVAKFSGAVSPRMAQVLQHHMEDFAGREDGDKKSITEMGIRDGVELGKPEKSMVGAEETDRADGKREKRDQSNADVLEQHQPDHANSLPNGLTPMTDEEHSERKDKREKKPKSTQDEIVVDRADKKASKSAQEESEEDDSKEAKSKKMPPEFLNNIKKKKAEDEGEDGESEESGPPESDHAEESEGEESEGEESMSEELDEMMEKIHDLQEEDLKQLLNAIESKLEPEGGAAIIEIGAPELSMPGEKEAVGDMCAAMECKGSAPHSAAECPMKKAQDMGGAPAVPAAPMPMMGSKTAARLERLYKNRLAKVSQDAQSKVAAATKTVEAKFARALKLAASRQALNIEASPLKAAMFDVLASEQDIDADSFYPGMDSITASVLVENTMEAGYGEFVDSLMKRATELMAMSDDAFKAIESDVKNLRPVPVQVHTAATKTASREGLRQAAVAGNMVLAPSAPSETISDVSKRDSIRSALDATKVRRASAGLLNKKS